MGGCGFGNAVRAVIEIDASLQKYVDDQLLEQGAFTVLELLIGSGRLAYADYERWRRREIESLDDVLMGSLEKIRAQLEQAVSYARAIGLVEQSQELAAWTANGAASGAALRASDEPRLHRLIAGRFVPARDAPQMDLFFDNPVATLTNGIVRALVAADPADAKRQLDRLYATAPNHSDLAGFDRLLAALNRRGEPLDDLPAMLDFLLDTAPTAKRLLGGQWRELMTPLWRALAHALHGQTFLAARPQLHRSFALVQAEDWAAAADSVREVPEWWRQPSLCMHLAQAGAFRHERAEALHGWFNLCWHAPEDVGAAIEERRGPDAGVGAAWQEFLAAEDELRADDADDAAFAPYDLPAWMLLHEPGLALQLPLELAQAQTPGEERYRLVHRWLAARRARRPDDELALRKALQASQPLLFRYLKRTVG